ncbi:MAG: hypothetical protein PVG97_04375, partial [Syntrophobacterales bacterium]
TGGSVMAKTASKVILACSFLLIFGLFSAADAVGQELAVKRQTDGSITIKSTPTKITAQVSSIVYCKAIAELMKEEKEKLNKLVSESRYQEAKDSLDLMKALHELRTEECK